MFMVGFQGYALPPRQHAVRGVIESIDHASRSVVLIESRNKTRRTLVWNDSTRLRRDGKKIVPEALQAGTTVRGYCRKEVGRFVLREVRWSDASSGRSATSTQQML
jgi:hypothetical protein